MEHNQNVSVEQKLNRNKDQQCIVWIKFGEPFQYKLWSCVLHSSVID